MKNLFIGIDVGGTKICSALVDHSGQLLAKEKSPTPRQATPKKVTDVIQDQLDEILFKRHLRLSHIRGIGIAIPGLVDTKKGKILNTPNMSLSGFMIAPELEKKLRLKVAIGNDVNLGTLGEKWLGAAKGIENVIGIFVGTGVGGGIILNDNLITGSRDAAGEIGHMAIDTKGPLCSCGNHGCLEAFAGRWAVERDIRQAVKKKKKTIITKLCNGHLTIIKSKQLSKALQKKDRLTTQIMKDASKVLGQACVSLRHIFDPQMIVLGGGVIEACGDFILPIVRKSLSGDKLFSKMPACRVVASKLGDDAVILGAVALVQQNLGINLFSGSHTHKK